MILLLVPIVIGFSVIALAGVGNRLKDGRHGMRFERWCRRHDSAWAITTFVSIIALIAMLGFLVGNHVHYAPFPAEYRAVETTLLMSRLGSTMAIERAAVLHKIVDMNKEIAKVRYWNDSIWVSWYIPDKMAELEYIR